MPASLRELLAAETRWTYGNLELKRNRPELTANDQEGHRGALRHLLSRPWLWWHLPLFAYVFCYAHRRAKRKLEANQKVWERSGSQAGSADRIPDSDRNWREDHSRNRCTIPCFDAPAPRPISTHRE